MEEVPPEAFESTTVSLEPIRSGSFNFWGNEFVETVTIVAADIEFPQIKATASLRSGDVMETVVNPHVIPHNIPNPYRFCGQGYVMSFGPKISS